MKLFEAVKTELSPLQVANHYGIETDRSGKAICLFHSDTRPSMKIYEEPNRGFYCFSCGSGGTVIDLMAKYFDTTIQETALKLAHDFSIQYEGNAGTPIKTAPIKKNPAFQYKEDLNHYTRILTEYLLILERWMQYAPHTPQEEPNILFFEAIREHDRVQHLTETLLQGSADERAEIIIYLKKDLKQYEQRFFEIAGRNAESLYRRQTGIVSQGR